MHGSGVIYWYNKRLRLKAHTVSVGGEINITHRDQCRLKSEIVVST